MPISDALEGGSAAPPLTSPIEPSPLPPPLPAAVVPAMQAACSTAPERQPPLKQDDSLKELLTRFSSFDELPRTPIQQAFYLLAEFFKMLKETFEWLDTLWEGITHQRVIQMEWDEKVLSEVCGIAGPGRLTMEESLQLVATMLARQKEALLRDPSLERKVAGALHLCKELSSLRTNFSESRLKTLVNEISSQVKNLREEALLLPIGYFASEEEGAASKPVEMLLEVSKQRDGKYTVAVISASKEVRDFFDRQVEGVRGTQSLERRIVDVAADDLIAILPRLLEIRTSPACTRLEGMREHVMQALLFGGSKVMSGTPTTRYAEGNSLGTLSEVTGYLKARRSDSADGKRCELALRLRLFLDICKGNPKALKNPPFWRLVKTTAIHLASLIEEDKALLGSEKSQGEELTRIYHELTAVLKTLDASLPEIPPLKFAPFLGGRVAVPTPFSIKGLTPFKTKIAKYPQVKPPLSRWNEANPIQTLQQWQTRIKKLLDLRQFERAGREATLMVFMMPSRLDWERVCASLGPEEAKGGLEALATIASAIQGKVHEKRGASSLHDIAALSMLTIYAFFLAHAQLKGAGAKPMGIESLAFVQKVIEELDQTHLPFFVKTRVHQFLVVNPSSQEVATSSAPPSFQSVSEALNYAVTGSHWQSWAPPLPLATRAPPYAESLTREINNSALVEFCPFGCGRDDHYALSINYTSHSYPTAFLLHQHEAFDPKRLIKEGPLFRDEATDLFYLQQILENPPQFHDRIDRVRAPLGHLFLDQERPVQVMNTTALYFDHPHFFKQAALRFQFESKVFRYNAFSKLLKPENWSLHSPYILGLFSRLDREIEQACALSDLGVAGYLASVREHLYEIVSSSSLSAEQKRAIPPLDVRSLLKDWAQELISKTDPSSQEKQKMLFPQLLSFYFKAFSQNCEDPCFKDPKDLSLILCMIGRLEALPDDVKERFDGEMRDQYLTLVAYLSPEVQKMIGENPSFITGILRIMHPNIAAKNLKWEAIEFPTLMALDEENTFYEYNLFSGTMTKRDQHLFPLPDSLKADPNVRSIFGDAVDLDWSLFESREDEGSLAYLSQRFPMLRIVLKKRPDVAGKFQRGMETHIQRKFKGQWLTYVRFEAQNLYLEGMGFDDSDLPYQVAAAIGKDECWLDPSRSEVFIFKPQGALPYGRIFLKEQGRAIESVALHKSFLLQPHEESMVTYATIEDPAYIQVRGTRFQPAEVNYLRCRLRDNGSILAYDIKEGKARSIPFPGYTLCPYGARPGTTDPAIGVLPLPRTFDSFHLLKSEGVQKVLIPLSKFNPHRTFAAERLPQVDPVFNAGAQEIPVYEYSIDLETNRLVAKNAEAYAYLAYICFVHWDYEGAFYYLQKARSASGYGEYFELILSWIHELDDPSANGIALHLGFELFQLAVSSDIRLSVKGRTGAEESGRRRMKIEELSHMYREAVRGGRAVLLQDKDGTFDIRDVHRLCEHIRAILKEGADKAAPEEMVVSRLEREEWIADLYKRYHQSSKDRERALDLSPAQIEEVLKIVKELIETWGDQESPLERLRAVHRSGAPFTQLEYRVEAKREGLGLFEEVKEIWLFQGNRKSRTRLSYSDPDWIVTHFRTLFNRILSLPKDSIDLLELERQLQTQSSHPFARSFLLKLIQAKRVNSAAYQEVLKRLPDKKMGSLAGPQWKSSREWCLGRLQEALQDSHFHRFALQNHGKAMQQAEELIGQYNPYTGQTWKQYFRKENPPRDDPWNLYGLGKRVAARLKSLSDSSDFPTDFSTDFTNLLLEEILGSSGAKSLLKLNDLFTILELEPIAEPQQTMPVAAPQEERVVTIKERYEVFLPKAEERVDQKPPSALLPKTASEPSALIPPLQEREVFSDEKFAQLFTVETKEKREQQTEFFDALKGPVLQRIAKEHKTDYLAFVGARFHVTLTPANARTLQSQLSIAKEKLVKEIDAQKRDLLQDVDRFKTPAGIVALRRLIGKGIKPSLETLISLWRRGEITNLQGLGLRSLEQEEMKAIEERVTAYLESVTKLAQLERAHQTLEAYLASEGDEGLAEELYGALSTKRYYQLSDPEGRDLLFLEYIRRILLRKQQVEIIREMLSDPNAVRQLRMGDGKSKVLLPLLAKRKAMSGGNLVILMLPEELYETNCRDLDETNRFLFGQTMHRFDFSRSSDRSASGLNELEARLCQTIRDQGFIMTTKRSMLAFRNSYVELITKVAKPEAQDRPQLLAQLKVMSRIMQLFAQRGDVLADEVDACLDVRKEVNFSLDESEPLDAVKIDMGYELIELLIASKEGEPLHLLAQGLKCNTQAAFSKEEIQKFLQELAGVYYRHHQTEMPGVSEADFVAYVTNAPSADKVEKQIEALKEGNGPLYLKIVTLKAFIDRGFGTTMVRVGNVNYGRDPVSGIWTIPYKASNTPHIGSEFDDDVEKIAFSLQDYLQHGVRYEQVQLFVTRLREQAIKEIQAAPSGTFLSINKTAANREFQALLASVDPKKELGELSELSMMDTPLNIRALARVINSCPEGRIQFCKLEVLPSIRQYRKQIHAVSADVVSLTRSFSGFTGTPWNRHTYHDKIHAKKNLGVDGSTWALMLEREVSVVSFAFDATRPFDSLIGELKLGAGDYQALIDTGAYLRGTKNSAFIEAVLKEGKVKAGVYFDDSGCIVKKRVGGEPQPIELAEPTDLMQTFTLYDQAHTVGADIKQGRKACAVVTIGENTFIRDLFQAVWRLRQLDRKQRVTLAVSETIKERILKGEKRELTMRDVLTFCLCNEALRETEDNFRSERAKILDAPQRETLKGVVELLSNPDIDEDRMAQIATRAEATALFIKVRAKEGAYDEYSKVMELEEPEKAFTRFKKSAEELFDTLAKEFEPLGYSAWMEKRKEELKARPPLDRSLCPDFVPSAQVEEAGQVELEAQTEMAVEQEVAVEAEAEVELELVAETPVPQVKDDLGGSGEVKPLLQAEIEQAVYEHLRVNWKLKFLADSVEWFDPNILVSAMFERNFATEKRAVHPQSIFYSNRKPVKHVLIAKYNNRFVALIPSVHEAHGPASLLFANPKPGLQAVQLALSAKEPHVMYATHPNPFQDPKDRKGFLRLYVQLKLFNGEIEYTKEEIEALKLWLQEKGVEGFKKYFETTILPTKPGRYKALYPKSALGKTFASLLPIPAQ